MFHKNKTLTGFHPRRLAPPNYDNSKRMLYNTIAQRRGGRGDRLCVPSFVFRAFKFILR